MKKPRKRKFFFENAITTIIIVRAPYLYYEITVKNKNNKKIIKNICAQFTFKYMCTSRSARVGGDRYDGKVAARCSRYGRRRRGRRRRDDGHDDDNDDDDEHHYNRTVRRATPTRPPRRRRRSSRVSTSRFAEAHRTTRTFGAGLTTVVAAPRRRFRRRSRVTFACYAGGQCRRPPAHASRRTSVARNVTVWWARPVGNPACYGMPVRRGHVTQRTTVIETIIKKFDTHSEYRGHSTALYIIILPIARPAGDDSRCVDH